MTGRRDTSARDAITYAADAGLRWTNEDHLSATDHAPAEGDLDTARVCEVGEHSLCGSSWCQCHCHAPGAWGER